MWKRELALALRAPVTWVCAALAALLVGHGFVLAIDLYSAASRSALGDALMAREIDPLAGVIRPTLGGAQLATAVLGPVLASRLLAVEKERRSFGALALAAGSTDRVIARKLLVAALVLVSLTLVGPAVLLVLFAALGGHVDPFEALIALGGHGLHAVFVATLSVMAAAWTRTSAQAAAVALVASLVTWMVDAGEGFAALAWLGPLEGLSISQKLAPFEHAIVSAGAVGWFSASALVFSAAAMLGGRFDVPARARAVGSAALALLFLSLTSAFGVVHRAYDWSELRRQSLPPAVVTELRAIDRPITVEVWMDRDDSRRRQIEHDVVAKLVLARSDLRVEMPLDEARADMRAAPQRDASYGKVIVRAGSGSRETRSTSRREIVTLVFEAAGRALPDYAQATYPGYPLVIEGARRTFAGAFAYLVLPGALLGIGLALTRKRSPR